MSPDRRAKEFQKAFYGRRKHDPKPIQFQSPRRWWESWPFRLAGIAAFLWVCAAVFL